MINEATVQEYMDALRYEFPDLTIWNKKPWWLRLAFSFPWIKNLRWETATQTIGMNVYLSSKWKEFSSKQKMSTLRHERRHLMQFDLYGTILMSLLYLLVFFPIGLAYYRAKFEREGYAESLRAKVEYYGATLGTKRDGLDTYIENFCGPRYLYMLPFRKTIIRWFNEDWKKATGT